MNSSNWTGRAPRTLSQCHFSYDADAIEHYRSGDRHAWIVPLAAVVALGVAMLVHLIARFV